MLNITQEIFMLYTQAKSLFDRLSADEACSPQVCETTDRLVRVLFLMLKILEAHQKLNPPQLTSEKQDLQTAVDEFFRLQKESVL